MDENKRFVTGLDVGSENVRAVIATVSKSGEFSIVGYNEGKSAGMRKGIPANLTGPAASIDKMLGDAERMGGVDVRSAYVSVNGSTVMSTMTKGMIAVGAMEHEISGEDLDRVEDVAVSGSLASNRKVLDVVPLEYALDGQGGIKDPLGMSGARLEMRACVVSALAPNVENLKKATLTADVKAERLIPTTVAAARAVLTERQKENGVAVVDFGAATTGIAIYEEGDLQYTGVIPIGSNNITNDLAIVLAIEPELAEEIKTRFITGDFETEKSVAIKIGAKNTERTFDRKEVEDVVKARLPANKLDQAKENGYRAMRRILAEYPDTTAVFAATDQLAIGAMVCLREAGLSVPRDLSLAGANDMEYASLPWFDLTTLSLNRTEMGRAAAQMLLDIIENRQTHPENLLLGTNIIVRGSTMKI